MKNNLNEIKSAVLDQEKEILFIQKLSEKNLKVLLKRIKNEINNTYKYSVSQLIVQFLPDIDNLEKALELSKVEIGFNDIQIELEKIINHFLNILKEYHISIINEINIPFDPTIHQAIALSPSKELKPNYVISVMQKGYKLHKRLLRPAMVLVSQ